ncbi:hypothetical protein BDR06DRAFT_958491 [Suillus hirtellus]|nr:hypothetical protein BDR06DRAFT_958491 [Suillus hirtellus]
MRKQKYASSSRCDHGQAASPSVSSLAIIAPSVMGKCRLNTAQVITAIIVSHAGLGLLTTCSERHTCCPSTGNDDQEEEMHDLCEVIQVLCKWNSEREHGLLLYPRNRVFGKSELKFPLVWQIGCAWNNTESIHIMDTVPGPDIPGEYYKRCVCAINAIPSCEVTNSSLDSYSYLLPHSSSVLL